MPLSLPLSQCLNCSNQYIDCKIFGVKFLGVKSLCAFAKEFVIILFVTIVHVALYCVH